MGAKVCVMGCETSNVWSCFIVTCPRLGATDSILQDNMKIEKIWLSKTLRIHRTSFILLELF